MRRVSLHVAALLALETSLAAALRPRPIDLLPPCGDSIPDVLRDDSQVLASHDVPLTLRLGEPPLTTGAGLTARLGPVPEPPSNVLLVLQDAADCRGSPSTARSPPAGNLCLVELLVDRGDRLAGGKVVEEAEDNLCLRWVDDHPISVRSRS